MSFCFLALTVPLNSELLRPAGALAFGHHHQSLTDSQLMKAKGGWGGEFALEIPGHVLLHTSTVTHV